ncbi:hypothetical protein ES703_84706 [subsurface metagenome]
MTLDESLASIAQSLEQLLKQLPLAAPLPKAPGVTAPWVAKEPEMIFTQAIRTADIFYSDKMVDWTQGKRLLIKVESSLDQDCDIQLIGNIADARELAVDVGDLLPCLAGGNISAGPAWDDWHPYIGVRIEPALAPTVGILTITAVIQE